MTGLLDPIALAGWTAPSRVMFGPHDTNLAAGRAISARHVAYYRRRAAGGAGIIVTETASVHPSDRPAERAPLAAACASGWRAVADACAPHGTLLLAGLGHAGLQGSSAYTQEALWGPSGFADPVTREVPVVMERPEIDELVAAFATAARTAVDAGMAGAEVDAGAVSLLRQFHSGLTNTRDDDHGRDRLLLSRRVLAAVRDAIGADHVLALRLSCDELAPWAGVTPEQGASQAAELAGWLDLLTVVRGGPYAPTAYRPDGHTAPMVNVDLCRQVGSAVGDRVAVALQGSVVEVAAAGQALASGVADVVEMTRAQLADAHLVAKLRAGRPEHIRPCVLCNQRCQVRDARNPIVSCVADPRTGHETEDTPAGDGVPGAMGATAGPAAGPGGGAVRDAADAGTAGAALVVGGGPAGLEAARVLAGHGVAVRLVERATICGGALRAAAVAPGRARLADLADWLVAACRRSGVRIETGTVATERDIDAAVAAGTHVILATGSRPRRPEYPVTGGAPVPVVDALTALTGGADALPAGPVVVDDPVGGPIGVGIAEWLAAAGRTVSVVTPDQVAGVGLAITGDLSDANVRLQRAGVARRLRTTITGLGGGAVLVEDVWTGAGDRLDCAVLIDAGHRLPDEELYLRRPGTPRVGDCVAPRTAYEAVLEGRRAALACLGRVGEPVG